MQNVSSLPADLVAALAFIKNPHKTGKANYGRYATLEACLVVARDALASHNLAIVQMVAPDPDRLITRLIHSSGESIEDGGVPLHLENKANPQKLGSAITYARRYGLCAMLGIIGEDDDDAQFATPVEQLPPSRVVKPAAVPIEDTFDLAPKPPVTLAEESTLNVDDQEDHPALVAIRNVEPNLKDLQNYMRDFGSELRYLERKDPSLFGEIQKIGEDLERRAKSG